MYSTLPTIHVQYIAHNTCTVHYPQYMYSTLPTIHVQYMYITHNTCTVHCPQYMYSTCTLPTIHVQYIAHNTCTVHVHYPQYMYSTLPTIHVQYMYMYVLYMCTLLQESVIVDGTERHATEVIGRQLDFLNKELIRLQVRNGII